MKNNKTHAIAFILLVIGGVNWGLIGLFGFDLVSWLFVDLIGVSALERLVYILVGVSAVYELFTHKSSCVHCGASGGASQSSAPASDAGNPGGM